MQKKSCMHSKIDEWPKNTEQICCFNPFERNVLFTLSLGTALETISICTTFSIFNIHVQIQKLEFKFVSSFHFIFANFFKPLLIILIKYEHCGGFATKWNFLYMDCIENKYIFFNLYVHSNLKYTHLIKISLKYIFNIVKYEYFMLAMLS